jgi:hypothetical protein
LAIKRQPFFQQTELEKDGRCLHAKGSKAVEFLFSTALLPFFGLVLR